MESSRLLLPKEKQLLTILIQRSAYPLLKNLLENLKVKVMNDGEMGSLLLLPDGIDISDKREMKERISEYIFKDKDGVDVLCSLNIDMKNQLYELDIWKTDFSPLIELP